MKYKIKHRYSGKVLYRADAASVRECVEKAVKDGANLQGANLQGTNLWGADLRDAYLQDANLRCANLQDANLEGANLQGTNLRGADLQGADLQGADLQGANLWYAKGILRFNGECHEAMAHTFKGVVGIKIGCEEHTAQNWLKMFKKIGKKEKYTKQEVESYGAFIKLAVKHFKGRK